MTAIVYKGLVEMGYKILNHDQHFFDTLTVETPFKADDVIETAIAEGINLRKVTENSVSFSLDETVSKTDIEALLSVFSNSSFSQKYQTLGNTVLKKNHHSADELALQAEISSESPASCFPEDLSRTSVFLTHPVFNSYHSETDMLRYLNYLQKKDLSLADAMIPLGSCTMKLNSTTEMIPVTFPEFSNIHPFVPLNQAEGYRTIIRVNMKHF
jgi:glycine dehydrogenase